MSKYTKGKWEVIEEDLSIRTKDFDVPQCGQGDYKGQIIASVDPTEWARICRKDVIPTMKANARLTVAARNSVGDNVDLEALEKMKFGQLWDGYKELLETLEKLVERIDFNGGIGEYQGGPAFVMMRARGIIQKAKAEGK